VGWWFCLTGQLVRSCGGGECATNRQLISSWMDDWDS
jgi:hypothetical protein